MPLSFLALLGSFVLSLSVTLTSSAAELKVFAAASLSEVLQDIAKDFQKQTGNKVVFNFGASSFLAIQIREGAPADVFFSADEAKMDGLEKKDLIVPGTRKSLLSNRLVIVVDKDSTLKIGASKDLQQTQIRRIALAEPKTVPAGIYAKAHLETVGVWNQVSAKIIPTENVRGALAAVEAGNVEAAIVYKTDALISKKVKVAYEIPAEQGPSILYPVGVVNGSKQVEVARSFVEYLASSHSQHLFERHGFIVRK